MRQIEFRGLRRDGLGWAYGYICPDKDGDMNIITEQPWEPIFRFKVHPKTVGQFITKLYGDTPVYHGDVLQMQCEVGGVRPKYVIDNDGIDWVLKFYGRSDGMNGQTWGRLSRLHDSGILRDFGKLIVTGNIHEQ